VRGCSVKVICAVAASILTVAYHLLPDGTFYQDLGADYFRRAAPEVQASREAWQFDASEPRRVRYGVP